MIHVLDHCRGVLLALKGGAPGGTYCFGGEAEITNLELVKEICSILDRISPKAHGRYEDLIRFVKDRPGHDFRYAIDNSDVRVNLGFEVASDFEVELLNTVSWYIERG